MIVEILHQKLMDAALRYLSIRQRSELELNQYLERWCRLHIKDADSKPQKSVLTRLKQMGYIDDLKFARWWVTSRSGSKPKGERIIEQELQHKGIDRSTIQFVLSEALGLGRNEYELANRAVSRVLGRWKALERTKKAKKVYEWVVRKGFSAQIASKIARTIDHEAIIEYTHQ